LAKYPEIVRRRQEAAKYYSEQLGGVKDWTLPPLVHGATYSHYVVRVPKRKELLKAMRGRGIELGELIDYSVPQMAAYLKYAGNQDFPQSRYLSEHTVNVPIYPQLQSEGSEEVVRALILSAEDSNDC
jgi:perosamine synthetase